MRGVILAAVVMLATVAVPARSRAEELVGTIKERADGTLVLVIRTADGSVDVRLEFQSVALHRKAKKLHGEYVHVGGFGFGEWFDALGIVLEETDP